MKNQDPNGHNLLDELSADAPLQRMRTRFDELLEQPGEPARSKASWLAWAAAAVLVIAGFLALRQPSPAPTPLQPKTHAVLEMLEAPSAFERLRAVNAVADLPEAWPALSSSLLERLEQDGSVNVRLSALGVLLDQDLSTVESDRLARALGVQETAILQAHLGHGLRRRQLVSRPELQRMLEEPEIHSEVRKALIRLEES